jgi:hypothetical protein
MATIFLSYRRTDGAQASRVREWLVRRLGTDAVFMDVASIPFAVSFPDYIKTEIESVKLLLALIGPNWAERINRPDDQVRPEIELALTNNVPVLPILIGTTPMPNPDQLPATIAHIVRQNAPTVGILNDFDTHMRALMPRIESILGALTRESVVTSDPDIIRRACAAISRFLADSYSMGAVDWVVVGTNQLANLSGGHFARVTLFLHRVTRHSELLELHFILSVWSAFADGEQGVGGWIIRQLEKAPVIPQEYLDYERESSGFQLKVRKSDEDPRAIWKMITDQPLRLSLAYVATISPA